MSLPGNTSGNTFCGDLPLVAQACEEIQGFLASRPVPGDELASLLEKGGDLLGGERLPS